MYPLGTPFRRALILRDKILECLKLKMPTEQQSALNALDPYEVRRKSSGAAHRSNHSVAQDKRDAWKERNRQRRKAGK